MSKPIKIVVVVNVVVVFVKKIRSKKNFDQKNKPCPKTLGLEVLDPKKKFG